MDLMVYAFSSHKKYDELSPHYGKFNKITLEQYGCKRMWLLVEVSKTHTQRKNDSPIHSVMTDHQEKHRQSMQSEH